MVSQRRFMGRRRRRSPVWRAALLHGVVVVGCLAGGLQAGEKAMGGAGSVWTALAEDRARAVAGRTPHADAAFRFGKLDLGFCHAPAWKMSDKGASAWRKTPWGWTRATADNSLVAELQECGADPAALADALPALFVGDERVRTRITWNGVEGCQLDYRLLAALHPGLARLAYRILITRLADSFLVLTCHGSAQALEKESAWIEEIAGDVEFKISGLRGEYFANLELRGEPVVRFDATVNFDYGEGAPMPQIPADGFSVRWTGQIRAAATGPCTLLVASDDGARLWLDDKLLIDSWVGRGTTEDAVSVEFEKDKRYALRLEYFESGGPGAAFLSWQPEGAEKQILPAAYLGCESEPGIRVRPSRYGHEKRPALLPEPLFGDMAKTFTVQDVPGLAWTQAGGARAAVIGQEPKAVHVRLILLDTDLEGLPELLPALKTPEALKASPIAWNDAVAWRVSGMAKGAEEGAPAAVRLYLCPLEEGVLVLSISAASIEALDAQNSTVNQLVRAVQPQTGIEKPAEDAE